MSNTLGNNLKVTLFGESHGPSIGCVLDGVPSGIKVDMAFINHQMSLRKPVGTTGTARKEADEVKLISGVFNGYTTGTPICILIDNNNVKSKDYDKTKDLARPSHADYAANVKYDGFQDYRGGGHFSGRLTAPLVAAGAIVMSMLKQKGIVIGSHLSQIGSIKDEPFSDEVEILSKQITKCNKTYYPVNNKQKEKQMVQEIEQARNDLDAVGGVIETAIINLPVGLGEPWFDSLEGSLSKALFGIGAIKGVAFGLGFDYADKRSSEVNDAFRKVGNKVITTTNNNGGINGGISNGMPVIFKTVVKPTPSIARSQKTINMKTNKNANLEITGRHDPCIVQRVRVVIDSVSALVIGDLLLSETSRKGLK